MKNLKFFSIIVCISASFILYGMKRGRQEFGGGRKLPTAKVQKREITAENIKKTIKQLERILKPLEIRNKIIEAVNKKMSYSSINELLQSLPDSEINNLFEYNKNERISLLHLMVEHRLYPVIKKLLEKGADSNKASIRVQQNRSINNIVNFDKQKFPLTPLIQAVYNDDEEAVSILLSYKLNYKEISNDNLNLALSLATLKKHNKIAKLLEEAKRLKQLKEGTPFGASRLPFYKDIEIITGQQ